MIFEAMKKSPEQILTEAENLILTAEEHNNHEFWQTVTESSLYSYKIEGNGKKVFFFGADHINDPNHPMFNSIREAFSDQKPEIVFIEGYADISEHKERIIEEYPELSEEDLIESDGERGLTLKLAVESGIDFDSPEPRPKEEVDHVLSLGHKLKDVMSYYILRGLDRNTDISLEDLLEKRKGVKNRYIPEDTDPQEVEGLYEKIIRENYPIDPVYIRNISSPMKTGDAENPINRVAKEISQYRNKTILKKLQEALKTHSNIFIVYGNSHALVLEKAIEKIVQG